MRTAFAPETVCDAPCCGESLDTSVDTAATRGRSRVAVLLLSAACLLMGGSSANATGFRFTDLGEGAASAINNRGQVVGQSGGYAAIWDRGTRTDLGEGAALDINDRGQVVGQSGDHATLWHRGSETRLGDSGGLASLASGINNRGQIVGSIAADRGYGFQNHATLWDRGEVTDLGPGTVASAAQGINNRGQMVGWTFYVEEGGPHAALWERDAPTDPIRIGPIEPSFAEDVNNAGRAVGYSLRPESGGRFYSATLWTSGRPPTDLGTLGGENSFAFGINEAGLIVGSSEIAGGESHATLWLGTRAMDLNCFLDARTAAAGWVLESATGVNDRGGIIGAARNSLTGQEHAYMLSATWPGKRGSHASMSVSAVPEPQTYILMLAGLGVLVLAVQRRKLASALGCAPTRLAATSR